jgi:non-ribosomal peptide synthetase component F
MTGPRAPSRSVQVREAVRAAAKAFNAVDDSVNDLLTVTAEGTPAHAQLTRLRLSLQTLLARYATHTLAAGPIPEPAPAAPSTPVTPATPNPGGSPFVE